MKYIKLGNTGMNVSRICLAKQQHLGDAVAALDIELSAEEVAMLETPYRPHAVVGFR